MVDKVLEGDGWAAQNTFSLQTSPEARLVTGYTVQLWMEQSLPVQQYNRVMQIVFAISLCKKAAAFSFSNA